MGLEPTTSHTVMECFDRQATGHFHLSSECKSYSLCKGPGAVAMMSNDILCIQDNLVRHRKGINAPGYSMASGGVRELRALLPEPWESGPLEGNTLKAARILEVQSDKG